jgi:hypothetical protein
MKPSRLLTPVLAVAALVAIERAGAASAVATDGRGHLVTSAGQVTEELAKYDALSTARKKYGANARLIAATGRTGYGAIATADRANGHGSIVAAALGQPTQAMADAIAIRQVLKGGGVNPQVRWRIRG